MSECSDIEARISAYLDAELTQQDRQRVELHMDACANCRDVHEELDRLRREVGGLPRPEPTENQWKKMMATQTIKTSRGIGWLLWIAGALLLAGYAAYAFATDDGVDAIVKIGVAAVVVGILLVLVSVLLERLRVRKGDRYKDVEL